MANPLARPPSALDDTLKRIAESPEHPYLAAVALGAPPSPERFFLARNRRAVDRLRPRAYVWNSALDSDAGRELFVKITRPNYAKSIGLAIDFHVAVDPVEALAAPNEAALYQFAAEIRKTAAWADYPRFDLWTPTPEQEKQILGDVAARIAYTKIAERARVSVARLRAWLQDRGVAQVGAGRGRPTTNASRDGQIRAAYESGTPARELAAEFGISEVRVRQIVSGSKRDRENANRIPDAVSAIEFVLHSGQTGEDVLNAWALVRGHLIKEV